MTINPIYIDDEDPRLSVYRDIREKDLVGRQKQFIAEGKVVLSVLLNSKRFKPLSLLITLNKLSGMQGLLNQANPTCPVYCVDQNIMDKIAGFHVHRGILAVGERITQPSLSAFLDMMPDKAVLAVLCGISNHDNMGAIFRNAAAFAADGIILDETSCDPLYRKAIRVSVGAALKVPYCQGETIDTIIEALDHTGFDILALTPSARVYLNDMKPSKRTALLFGTEGVGLPIHVLQKVKTLRIPIAADFDSLNVATSTGLALSHFANATKLS